MRSSIPGSDAAAAAKRQAKQPAPQHPLQLMPGLGQPHCNPLQNFLVRAVSWQRWWCLGLFFGQDLAAARAVESTWSVQGLDGFYSIDLAVVVTTQF